MDGELVEVSRVLIVHSESVIIITPLGTILGSVCRAVTVVRHIIDSSTSPEISDLGMVYHWRGMTCAYAHSNDAS